MQISVWLNSILLQTSRLIQNVKNKYKVIFIRVKSIKLPTKNPEIILCNLIIISFMLSFSLKDATGCIASDVLRFQMVEKIPQITDLSFLRFVKFSFYPIKICMRLSNVLEDQGRPQI